MWFSKKIIFEHDPKWEDFLKDVYPVPAKLNIPTWYKNLKHTAEHKTIKGCMPFLDSLTSGYILKMPQDLYVAHNVDNPETKQKDSFFQASLVPSQRSPASPVRSVSATLASAVPPAPVRQGTTRSAPGHPQKAPTIVGAASSNRSALETHQQRPPSANSAAPRRSLAGPPH